MTANSIVVFCFLITHLMMMTMLAQQAQRRHDKWPSIKDESTYKKPRIGRLIYLSTRYPMTEDPDEEPNPTTRIFQKAKDPLVVQDYYSKSNLTAERWPHNLVPFTILYSFADAFIDNLTSCFDAIEEKTCVRFRYFPDLDSEDLDLVNRYNIHPLIISQRRPLNNYATIGYDPSGGNWLEINERICKTQNCIFHLLMHVLGFDHEYVRSDRDKYVSAKFGENLDKAVVEKEWNKTNRVNAYTYMPYNHESVMNIQPPHSHMDIQRKKFKLHSHQIQKRSEIYHYRHWFPYPMHQLDFNSINLHYQCGEDEIFCQDRMDSSHCKYVGFGRRKLTDNSFINLAEHAKCANMTYAIDNCIKSCGFCYTLINDSEPIYITESEKILIYQQVSQYSKVVEYMYMNERRYPAATRERIANVMLQIQKRTCLKFKKVNWPNRAGMSKTFIEIWYNKSETICWVDMPTKTRHAVKVWLNPIFCPTSASVIRVLKQALGMPFYSWSDLHTFEIADIQNVNYILKIVDSRMEHRRVYELMPMNYRPQHQLLITCNVLSPLNMDVRTEDLLSFKTMKDLNQIHCQGHCSSKASNCQHQGFKNPHNCDECICPSGLSGKICQTVTPNAGAVCIGRSQQLQWNKVIKIGVEDLSQYYYIPPIDCTWLFTSPIGTKIAFNFTSLYFGYNCTRIRVCRDYMEVKGSSDLSEDGFRFCCNRIPPERMRLVSEVHRMMVFSRISHTGSIGFEGYVKMVSMDEPTTYPWGVLHS